MFVVVKILLAFICLTHSCMLFTSHSSLSLSFCVRLEYGILARRLDNTTIQFRNDYNNYIQLVQCKRIYLFDLIIVFSFLQLHFRLSLSPLPFFSYAAFISSSLFILLLLLQVMRTRATSMLCLRCLSPICDSVVVWRLSKIIVFLSILVFV